MGEKPIKNPRESYCWKNYHKHPSNTYNIILLISLRPSVACSNIVCGGVPTLISGHIAVRLHRYIKLIKTGLILLIHFQLNCHPTLIMETYSLLFPPAHGHRRYQLPLLCHPKVKY